MITYTARFTNGQKLVFAGTDIDTAISIALQYGADNDMVLYQVA